MMKNSDSTRVFDELAKCFAFYGRTAEKDTLRMWWDLLSNRCTIDQFSQALKAHMLDAEQGRFMPTVAHIVRQLEKFSPKSPAHLTADEAWSIACEAADENNTVIWTQPIAQAWGLASSVLPDRTGARMAFKAAYERIMSDLPAGHEPLWFPSLGHDSQRRQIALDRAIRLGQITHENAYPLLRDEKSTTGVTALLETAIKKSDPAVAKQWLAKLREMTAGSGND